MQVLFALHSNVVTGIVHAQGSCSCAQLHAPLCRHTLPEVSLAALLSQTAAGVQWLLRHSCQGRQDSHAARQDMFVLWGGGNQKQGSRMFFIQLCTVM